MTARSRSVRRTLLAALLVVGAGLPALAESIDEMLAREALKRAYNPVLLDFLLEEGAQALDAETRQKALDQLVTALRKDIEITPEEQRAAALAAASAGVAQLFGGDAGELGAVAQDATYQIWKGWVDSALTLQRAGYAEDAERFFVKCIEIYPYSDLRGRCAIGLAAGKPGEAYERLVALSEGSDMETARAALRLLGELAGSEGFPAERRAEVVSLLEGFTKGMKKASYGRAACQGLVATGDRAVVPILSTLSKGMMNQDFYSCARSGLLLDFGDRSVVPVLEKQLKGGTFSTTKPHERLFAASLLMRAGEATGFAFAEAELTRVEKKGMTGALGRFMKSDDDKVDLRPALVRGAVRAGGPSATTTLRRGIQAVEPGSWLETWIAIGLLELDDPSSIDLVRKALGNPSWEFTTVRMATALARHGDESGIPALGALYDRAAKGLEPDTGRAVLSFLAGEGGEYLADQESKKDRLIFLRRQIAHALGAIDRPACIPILTRMLDDGESAVRMAAAFALAGMSDPGAAAGLEVAIQRDYGEGGDRNPVVHAELVRAAAARFPGAPASRQVVRHAWEGRFDSVRFLALSVKRRLGR